jgi:hypothetical protein
MPAEPEYHPIRAAADAIALAAEIRARSQQARADAAGLLAEARRIRGMLPDHAGRGSGTPAPQGDPPAARVRPPAPRRLPPRS